jgi:uncharacterized protein YoxC
MTFALWIVLFLAAISVAANIILLATMRRVSRELDNMLADLNTADKQIEGAILRRTLQVVREGKMRGML